MDKFLVYTFLALGVLMFSLGIIFIIISTAILRGFYQEKVVLKRKKAGQCLKCGYDLRVTPTRCPECGVSNEKQTTL